MVEVSISLLAAVAGWLMGCSLQVSCCRRRLARVVTACNAECPRWGNAGIPWTGSLSVSPTGRGRRQARRVLARDRFAVCLPAAFRVVFLVVFLAAFLTLAADFDADFLAVRPAGFLLLDFLAAYLRPTD